MKSKKRYLAFMGSVMILVAVFCVSTVPAQESAGAVCPAVNTEFDGPGHCKGNPFKCCHVFDGKEYAWLDGSFLFDGQYFFAVLTPSGVSNPNDGSPGNLSDDYRDYTYRTFTVTNGSVSYSGSHQFDDGYIRLAPYDYTDNAGGIYILAVCSMAQGYPVDPSDCSYNAFRVAGPK